MAYGNQGDFQRKMYQGNWHCSKCQSEITELPFEPDPARLDQLLCRDCHRQKRQSFGGGRGGFRR
jgi:CxxC-x17-CxxC domain-containing protein